MEFVAGLPLAVGAAGLKLLNSLLEDERVARAWYGDEYKTFTKKKGVGTMVNYYISHVFTISEQDCPRMIDNSTTHSQSWHQYREKHKGECCWLPIYRSLKEQDAGLSTVAVAYEALGAIGALSSIPAARVDAWGLVVMAYANGAQARVNHDGGAYLAVLRAKYFVLTIRRKSLTDEPSAHLEPRSTAFHSAQTMDPGRWRSLFDEGHTLHGEVQWVLDSHSTNSEPPEALYRGTLDFQLSKAILDSAAVHELIRRLAEAVLMCRKLWAQARDALVKRSATEAIPLGSQGRQLTNSVGSDFLRVTGGIKDVIDFANVMRERLLV
jgi:hypothetical protein